MGDDNTEACGRCGLTSVVDMNEARDPYSEECIEVEERDLRRVSAHQITAGRIKTRLDGLAQRLIYGR